MKNPASIIIITSLLGTPLAVTLLKGISDSQPPPPVAIMSQHDSTLEISHFDGSEKQKRDSTKPAGTLVNSDRLTESLKEVSEYSQNVYDRCKANDWGQATANMLKLKNARSHVDEEIKDDNVGLTRLNTWIAKLDKDVTAKNHLAATRDANQVTIIAAKIAQRFQSEVPIEIALLSYHGRELEIWAPTGNTVWLHKTAKNIRRNWDRVRPTVFSRGGNAQVQKFDTLVADVEMAKKPNQYSSLATPIQKEANNLEQIFK